MVFDVRVESWIPVRTLDGDGQEVGLYDLLNKAQDYLDIDGATPMETYSLYRFLSVFLMTIFRPATWEDKDELFSAGRFDISKVDEYIEKCQQDGISFDIFDKNKPFLQAAPNEAWDTDKTIKYVAILDSTRASGNNAIHFDHNLERSLSFSPAEAIRGVITAQIFCTAMSGGYPSGVNGAPPLYFLPRGSNLFETLVLSMNEVDEDNAGKPLWDSDREIIPKEEVTKTSQLYGMFFPSRRIRLIEENGSVKQIYYQPGLHFTGFASWNDPHVAYRRGKDDNFSSIKPSLDKEPWRNIKPMSEDYENGSIPAVVNDFYKIQEENGLNDMPIQMFGVATSNASYLETQSGMMRLDARIIGNQSKRKYVAAYIDMAEKIGYILDKSLKKMISPDDSKRGGNEVRQYVHYFYLECEKKFYEIMQELAVSKGVDEENKLMEKWNDVVKSIVVNLVQRLVGRYCFKAVDLIRARQQEIYLIGSVNKIIKGE